MGRIQVVLSDETEKKFREELTKRGFKKGDISEEIESLIVKGMSEQKIGENIFLSQEPSIKIDDDTKNQIQKFFEEINTLEKKINKPLIILEDKRIKAFYTECHILAEHLINLMDLDPSIDPDYQEDFRSNRNFEPTNPDYLTMVDDAKKGRQFSDIVIEYNPSPDYKRPEKPLKVFGGQHRSHAILEAFKEKINLYHGIRVYFNLNMEQRWNVAIISNTNIHVSNDLRDRMDEQSMRPANKLRDWCYKVGLLDEKKKEDFSSKRTQDIITVRLIRTFIINFYMGKSEKSGFDSRYIVPELANTGSEDDEYLKLYRKFDFSKEEDLVEAGKEFVKLHKKQNEKGEGKSKMLALALSITSSWAYTAGLLQKDKNRLKKFYSLPDLSEGKDPLKSNVLINARGDEDPSMYRGMINRYGEKERGRLLQLFLIYSKSSKNSINKDMVDLAIKSYRANKHAKEMEALKKKVI
jgi:hypothetical protein